MPFLPSHPPRCLQAFRTTFVPTRNAGLPEGVSFNSFSLQCVCGGTDWKVFGYWCPEAKELDDPLILKCCRCSQVFDLLDRDRDGYDGEIGGSGRLKSVGPKDLWNCSICGTDSGGLIASLGYQYDPFDPLEPEAKRAQDYFDAFILTHLCRGTDRIVEIVALECA